MPPTIIATADEVIELRLFVALHESGVGTNRTNRAGLAMSVHRGGPEVAFRGREDRC
jgi:hypothetical protein